MLPIFLLCGLVHLAGTPALAHPHTVDAKPRAWRPAGIHADCKRGPRRHVHMVCQVMHPVRPPAVRTSSAVASSSAVSMLPPWALM